MDPNILSTDPTMLGCGPSLGVIDEEEVADDDDDDDDDDDGADTTMASGSPSPTSLNLSSVCVPLKKDVIACTRPLKRTKFMHDTNRYNYREVKIDSPIELTFSSRFGFVLLTFP